MAEPDRSHTVALWTALAVTVLWSSSWVLIRIGLDDHDLRPLTFAGLRYALAAAVLIAVVAGRPATRQVAGIDAGTVGRLVLLGLVFYAVTQGAQFVAIGAQPAATTSLMLAPTALLVAVFSQRSLGERVSARQVLGAALIVVGAVAYFAGDLGATAVGMVAASVGLAANVASSLLGRGVNRRRNLAPVVVTAVSMGVGAVVLLGVGIAVEGLPRLSVAVVAVIAWLALVNTAFAFTLWNASLRRLAAVESAAINNTMLVQIAVLAWVFLGEPPGLAGWVGIVVVSAGTFLAQSRRATPSSPLSSRR